MSLRLRPFEAADYGAYVAVSNRCFPDDPTSETMARHQDSLWEPRYFKLRLVAEIEAAGSEAAGIAGWGQVRHVPWQFHPDRYSLSINVDPARQRQGIGSALFDRLLEAIRARNAWLVRAHAKESSTAGVVFLQQRGFRDVQHSWESRLDVAGFDAGRFAGVAPRVAGQGIVITTLGAEESRPDVDRDAVRRAVYDLDQRCTADEPSLDPFTPRSLEHFVRDDVQGPNALPDAFFLARVAHDAPRGAGGAYVGLSALYRNLALPGVLNQGFTCVQPDYRGRGIAMALKLQTVNFARERGYREIRTGNNSRNRPMLAINEALGFVKEPVWVEYQLDLRP